MLRGSRVRLILKISPSPKPKWFGAFLLCQSRQKISALALQLCQNFPICWCRKNKILTKPLILLSYSAIRTIGIAKA
jgi:hypothetical protein